MKTLISGHRGFVGRHFWSTLRAAGHDLTGVDTQDPFDPWDCRGFFNTCDDRFDLVIHLAAIVGGRATIEGQPLKVATDLSIDADFFQWCLRTKPRRVVYYSSSAAYPVGLQNDLSLPYRLREDDLRLDLPGIGTPDMSYGWSKLTGELLARYAEDEGIRTHVFRPFSGYGEDQDGSYPFGAFRDRALMRADPFEVWGTGEQCRDFIHIEDLVAATLAAVEQDVPGPTNLCTGRATSFLELAELFTKTAGYSPVVTPLEDKPVGVRYRVGDPTKMLTFHTPKIELEEGIRRALG
jgi:nucleoside-diphosphate-sugar epimerase